MTLRSPGSLDFRVDDKSLSKPWSGLLAWADSPVLSSSVTTEASRSPWVWESGEISVE